MSGTWSTSASLDLHLELPATRPRAALESALRDAVRGGRLAPRTRLPSSRALALDLGIARNTVAEAYGQLVAEGWFAAQHGSGTWVAERAGPLASRAGSETARAGRRPRYDLRPGVPDLTLFPRPAWLAAARRALAAAPARDLGYTDPRGLEVLRVAIAEYVARARGVITTPDRIVVCAGFAQGLELLCETLRDRGVRSLAVEAYGHPGHRGIAMAAGMRLTPLPVDDQGADVAALLRGSSARDSLGSAASTSGSSAWGPVGSEPRPSGSSVSGSRTSGSRTSGSRTSGSRAPGQSGRGSDASGSSEQAGRGLGRARAGAVLLTPAHQFPLGAALAPTRRRQVVDWATQADGLVIEDDYDGEFRYDRQAVGALQALAPERVVYGGTASKSLVPGLRLGWLALPGDLVTEVAERKQVAGRCSSLDQLALAEFINSGGYDRQVRRARLVYRQRRDRLVSALAREVPGVQVTGIAAGLHVLVRLSAGQTEADVIARAAARGLALHGVTDCGTGDQDLGPAIIVGYANPPGHAFSAAVARLCAALSEAARQP